MTAVVDTGLLGVWSAPGRVNLIGEHTDYNGGFALPFAIDARTTVTVSQRSDRRVHVSSHFGTNHLESCSLDLDEVEQSGELALAGLPQWARYPLGVVWALLEASERQSEALTGLDLAFTSTVPLGAGLSSSAAIECATAVALNDVWALGLDRTQLALVGQRAENVAVGAPTGNMDQLASMLGETGSVILIDCRSLVCEPVSFDLEAAGLELLVIDTMVSHEHASGGYGERRASCDRAARAADVTALRDLKVEDLAALAGLVDETTFKRARHIVTENARVLETVRELRTHGPAGIGTLLTASHVSMRDDFEISTPELDCAVDAAIAAGALGARMTGGGFGGSAIALVPVESSAAVRAAVLAAFDSHGFAEPRVFAVMPSAGAGPDGGD